MHAITSSRISTARIVKDSFTNKLTMEEMKLISSKKKRQERKEKYEHRIDGINIKPTVRW